MQYHPKATLYSAKGGTLAVHDFDTGEILAEVAIPPGRVRMSDYADLVGLGEWRVAGDVAAITPPSGYAVQPANAVHETGANPDWRPTSATRLQNEMRVMVNRMVGHALKTEQRERAIQKLVEMPTRKPAPEPEVIEPEEPATAPAGDELRQ